MPSVIFSSGFGRASILLQAVTNEAAIATMPNIA